MVKLKYILEEQGVRLVLIQKSRDRVQWWK